MRARTGRHPPVKDRLVTLSGALLALLAVGVLLVPSPDGQDAESSVPTTTDRGRYGLAGLKRWLSEENVPTLSWRRRYDVLIGDPELSDTGNLLILSLPQKLAARERELGALYDWLAAGNSVLILAALNDDPPWSVSRDWDAGHGLLSQLGFNVDTTDEEDGPDRAPAHESSARSLSELIRSLDRKPKTLAPACRHPLLDDVAGVETHHFPALERKWYLESKSGPRLSLPLLWTRQDAVPALWETRAGEGRAWISSYPDLFGNVTLGLADNAQLMVNLVRAALGSQGTVIFDDMHQGLSTLYDPDAFFSDPRLHHTVWFVLGFWLLYIMGRSNRLAPLRIRPIPRRAVELVQAMAGLFARRLPENTVGLQLFSHFFNRVRTRHGLPTNGKPVWPVLEQSPRLDAATVGRLSRLHEAAASRRKLDLVELTNLLNRTREELA